MRLIMNLQLFAEGGNEGTADTPLATESTGEGAITSTGNGNPGETLEGFDELIKGKYKAEYESAIAKAKESAVKARFKENADRDAEFNRLKEFANTVSQRYGTAEGDYDALTNAFIEDDMYLEREAMERGIDKDTLKEMKKIQHENDVLKRRSEEEYKRQQIEESVAKINAEVDKVKEVYPNFDLNTEMQNPDFDRLARNGVPLITAYQVVHSNEIIPAAMQTAVNKTKEDISKAIQSGSMRPKENGIGTNNSPSAHINPAAMSKAERDEIRKRVMRGERITFS